MTPCENPAFPWLPGTLLHPVPTPVEGLTSAGSIPRSTLRCWESDSACGAQRGMFPAARWPAGGVGLPRTQGGLKKSPA